MKRLVFATGFAVLLAWSAPAAAEPAMSGPDERPPAGLQLHDARERWFFGDGGFSCPLWWCGDAGLPPDRPRQAAASERWFFGDGGFGCPLWWCGDRFGDDPAGQGEP